MLGKSLPLTKTYCLLTPKFPTIRLKLRIGAGAITDPGLNKSADLLFASFPSKRKSKGEDWSGWGLGFVTARGASAFSSDWTK